MNNEFERVCQHFNSNSGCSFSLSSGSCGTISTEDGVVFSTQSNGCSDRFFGLRRAFMHVRYSFPGAKFLIPEVEKTEQMPSFGQTISSFNGIRWNSPYQMVTMGDIISGYNYIVLLVVDIDCDEVTDEISYRYSVGARKFSFRLDRNSIHPVYWNENNSKTSAAQILDDCLNYVILSLRRTHSIKTGIGWKEVLQSGVVGWLAGHQFDKILSDSIFQNNSPELLLFTDQQSQNR